MTKGLFTSIEEIKFHHDYIQGNSEKAYDPNTRRNPSKTRKISSKKSHRNVSCIFSNHARERH